MADNLLPQLNPTSYFSQDKKLPDTVTQITDVYS